MTWTCLIVGLGQIGINYDLKLNPKIAVYSHARAFDLHDAFELVGGVDVSNTRCSLFEGHYKKPSYTDLTHALAETRPSVVIISTPTDTHNTLLNIALACPSVDAILCEKPFGNDKEKTNECLRKCHELEIKVFVNYIRRADPGAIEVREMINRNIIASPLKGTAWYAKGLLNNGSHTLNLLEFWLGKIYRVQILDNGRLWNNCDPEPDLRVTFERGTILVQACWEEKYSHCAVELMSPSGRLRYDRNGEEIVWQSAVSDSHLLDKKILNPKYDILHNEMYRYQWSVTDQLANALDGQSNDLCTGEQALRTLDTMDQIIAQMAITE